ncbi:MAG: sulfurtransferase [Vicinamibacterales bacterium]
MFTTLIDPASLASHLDDPHWIVVDCRFDLTDRAAGEEQYRDGHIPGAHYAHLDRDLSGSKTGMNGRHPLPSPHEMRERFGRLGIGDGRQVVAYDADSGIFAARLWWMLRYMGHDAVAVLDGGLARWVRDGHATRGGVEDVAPATFVGEPRPDARVTVEEVLAGLSDANRVLVDARSNERYRGDGETLDAVGGHIPGAVNFFWQENVAEDKAFKSPADLRTEWQRLLAGRRPNQVVMYCGSGVTACANLLGMAHAGLEGARLYAGSWSEWSQDAKRPVATGADL